MSKQFCVGLSIWILLNVSAVADEKKSDGKHHDHKVDFTIRSVGDGNWSDVKTWQPARLPSDGDRVLVSRGTKLIYDVQSDVKLRLVQVVGKLSFARDRDTLINVGVLKVQNSNVCSESGFACDFHDVNKAGEPVSVPDGQMPALEVGTIDNPIPAEFTARIRLHYFQGMDKQDAPAIACCSARMDFHGTPMSRTWADLGADAKPRDRTVVLSQEVTGWRAGDEVIVTGAKRTIRGHGVPRNNPRAVSTEARRVTKIEGRTITLDRPLEHEHFGSGDYRSEVANLSRNVIIESAEPTGVRGHTIYHMFSRGAISYARFSHLGKEGVLGRYSIHFHLVGNTMRGSSVLGRRSSIRTIVGLRFTERITWWFAIAWAISRWATVSSSKTARRFTTSSIATWAFRLTPERSCPTRYSRSIPMTAARSGGRTVVTRSSATPLVRTTGMAFATTVSVAAISTATCR